jgi:ubiquinone biosynthesis protein
MFDMHLRPELVLLQKTMVTVEGVARSIDPKHDRWDAAEPIVRRWIARELSPATRARELADDAVRALKALARLADPPAPVVVPAPRKSGAWLWFALGVAASALGFGLYAVIR